MKSDIEYICCEAVECHWNIDYRCCKNRIVISPDCICQDFKIEKEKEE